MRTKYKIIIIFKYYYNYFIYIKIWHLQDFMMTLVEFKNI